jgi:hypothetical protein
MIIDYKAIIKIVLAVLFFLCLLDMPYGFYQLVRFSALLVFGILAFDSYKDGFVYQMIIYLALALLFQPFIKVSLGRNLWNILDVIIGIGLILSIILEKNKNKSG